VEYGHDRDPIVTLRTDLGDRVHLRADAKHSPSEKRNTESRRRVPRTSTGGWTARYLDEDESDSGWRPCIVVDISLIGVGLELLGGVRSDLIGHQLVVQVQAPVGESVTLRLKGRVVNLGKYPAPMTRAGLEFVGLAEMEKSILKVLEQMKVAW
jgi:hypothetical protein